MFCLGHIPHISAAAIVNGFDDKAGEGDLEDPAQGTAPCHSLSAYTFKKAIESTGRTDSHPTRVGD